MPCTEQCELLANAATHLITLNNPADPAGGLTVTHASYPSTPDDPYQCPPTPLGIPILRTWIVVIACDAAVEGLVADTTVEGGPVIETSVCEYTAYARSSKACGMKTSIA